MYFAHDPTNNFYYLGDEEPSGALYRKYLLDSEPKIVGVDVETISLKERIAIGVGIAVEPLKAFYFPLFPTESPTVPWKLLRDPTILNIYHNGIFDLECLFEYDINTSIMDTNIMSRLLCNKFNGLSDLSWAHRMEVHEVRDILAEYNAKIMLDIPQEVVARKCMQDAGAALKLYQVFMPQTNIPYFLKEMETIPIMDSMSRRGLLLDHTVRMALEQELEGDVATYLTQCEDAESFNPASPQQVSWTLADRGAYSVFSKLPFTRNKYGRSTGNLSSAKEVLEKMDDPLAQLILRFREKSKLLSTYIKPWADEDRAFTHFHLDAITGRPSSTDRNMQNLPGAKTHASINCRGMIIPDSGTWTDWDFSQLELRILAHVSQDREMLYTYETGGDIHQIVADFMGIDRKIAKNVNFAMIYGGTDQTLMETAHIRTIQTATRLRIMWFDLFREAGDYIQSIQRQSHYTNKAVTIYGREMRLPTEEEENADAIERKAVNYPIQGSAADILKRALIYCKDMDLALQVHDELLIDGIAMPNELEAIEHMAPFHTPIDIKYLERWQ